MIADANKDIASISYNLLNLPVLVTKSNSDWVKYTLVRQFGDAAGIKLKKEASISGNVTTTDYVGGKHYINDALSFFSSGVGRIVKSGNDFNYEYNLSDHLGNVRVSLDTAGQVIQRDDYYPFGLTFQSYTGTNPKNEYGFQGQEFQEELGWHQYKWRNADPALGRFFNVDPLAEKYLYNSTYAFSENKVVAHKELEGLEAVSGDQVVSNGNVVLTYGLEFKASVLNLVSLGLSAMKQDLLSPYVKRRQFTVVADESGNVGLHDELIVQNKLSAGLDIVLSIAGTAKMPNNPAGFLAKTAARPAFTKLLKNGAADLTGKLIKNNKADDAADALAQRLGGESRVSILGYGNREFDAVSDNFVAQTKDIGQIGKAFRDQAKATFEAAKGTNRKVYYEFTGQTPSQQIFDKLNEYSERYGVELVTEIVE